MCKYIHNIVTSPQDSQYYQGRLIHQLLSLCSSPLRQKIQTLVSMYHQIQKQLLWTLEQTARPHGDPYTYFFLNLQFICGCSTVFCIPFIFSFALPVVFMYGKIYLDSTQHYFFSLYQDACDNKLKPIPIKVQTCIKELRPGINSCASQTYAVLLCY